MLSSRGITALVSVSSVAALASAFAYGCSSAAPTDCASNADCPVADGGPDGTSPDAHVDGAHPDGAKGDGGPGDGSGVDATGQDAPEETTDGGTDAPVDAPFNCDGGGLACDFQCYSPTDVNHCGSCDNQCTAPANGTATCTPGADGGLACGFNCGSSGSPYHVCGAVCDPNTDVPSDTSDPCIISETYGIFVSPGGLDTNAGTQLSPVHTITHAIALAHAAGKRVYACAGTYGESLTAVDGVSLYGGLDCTTTPSQWAYTGTKAVVEPPAQGYALQLTGISTGVTFEDFTFEAQPGVNPGDSSIAVFAASSSNVVLRRCSVTAGAPVNGSNGKAPAPYTTTGPNGNPGSASVHAGGTGAGGQAIENPSCPSVGGAGGSGSAPDGGPPVDLDGEPGEPGGATNDNAGTSAACVSTGTGGGNGAVGSNGSLTGGAASWASLTASGWIPTAGSSGSGGAPAQGGGGGSAGAAGIVFGGGGGGGAGGCGGAGGPPGTGGGSSIAVLLYDATVELDTCSLLATNAGNGGNGTLGQAGQQGGGGGGGGGTAACSGGAGGQGGQGGPGGGGAGGLSAGVVWLGTAPNIVGGSQTVGSAGTAGQNGDGTTTAKAGTAGGVVQFQ